MNAAEPINGSAGGNPVVKAGTVELFLAFIRLGLTAFGGPAMVAYVKNLSVGKKRWLTQEDFDDGAALCQSIPGATAMQTAAYVGLRAGGPLGALAAYTGFVLPAAMLMLGLSAAYRAGQNLQPVLAILQGLNAVVVAIIANAAIGFGFKSIRNWRDFLLTAAAAGLLFIHISPIAVIAGSALAGTLLYIGADQAKRDSPASEHNSERRRPGLITLIVLIVAAGLTALYFVDSVIFNLSLVMLKVDFFAFGGGFASVPLMQHEVVDVRGWLDQKTFMDGIALGQVTPGPIVITATFAGYQIGGIFGAIIATVAIFTPSFFLVLLTVPHLDHLKKSRLFQRALRGVLASFVGLLAAIAAAFGLAISWTAPLTVLAVAAFLLLRMKVDIIWVVFIGAAVSLII